SFVACSSSSEKAQSDITPKELNEHIKTLASDEYGGRAPGTPGGKKTIEYIKEKFKKVGLQPANGDSWVQEVPLVTITVEQKTPVTFKGLDKPVTLHNSGKAVLWSMRVKDTVKLENSEMV